MLKKTFIAASAAAAIGLGALGATTTAANASHYGHPGGAYIAGPGFSLSFGNPGYPHYNRGYQSRVVCKPEYRRVRDWDRRHGWTWKRVYVGQDCRPYWAW